MITVFTPTYNRRHLLHVLFESLLNQTCYEFEWLIVDDGSTDNTNELINTFDAENKFKIRYYKQNNQGKHIAINHGVQLAQGDIFFIVDSDDWLLPNSINLIYSMWDEIVKRNDYVEIAGVSGTRIFSNGKVNTSNMYFDVIYGNIFDVRYKHGIFGDMAEVYKTSVLKEYPFPVIENEKFCFESLIWNRIGEKYKLRFSATPIYCGDYLEGGITDKSITLRAKNPKYTSLIYQEIINSKKAPFLFKVRAAVNYWRFSSFDYTQSFLLKCSKVKLWSILFFGIGFLIYLKDKYSRF